MATADAAPPPAEVKARLKERAERVEAALARHMEDPGAPPGLAAAMRYSLLAGGKRIRPALCLLSAGLCGLDEESAMPFACAIECIHSYSLIHDDLPAMDDDDLRRGKPSCHKAFDEATAILAGDGLLTDAFVLMTRPAGSGVPPERVLEALRLAAEAAGSSGMVGGQFLDMLYTNRDGVGLEDVAAMQAMKTGAMLRMSCETGAVLAGADEAARAALRAYGTAIGAAFQITDDILDETGSEAALGKPVGSDAAAKKNTYPALVGLHEARRLAHERVEDALAALGGFTGPQADLLRGLAAYIANRVE